MSEWQLDELADWDRRITDQANVFGLNCYPQEFEICDSEAMLGYMAYHGMPSHYPHWSFGKSYEQTRTRYEYGVSGLPYEMVINSDPCLAYLMQDNSLCLQVLTIAHVYGHNDFFKNNFTFTSATNAKETIAAFKARADRVRGYINDPSIGADTVERFLDAAHALSFNRSRNLGGGERSSRQRRRLANSSAGKGQPNMSEEKRRNETGQKDDQPKPQDLEGSAATDPARSDLEENILLTIRDFNQNLETWQQDLLTIVDEEACYFIPQIETKIMNEGWASYWHYKIMNALDLPDDIRIEFMVRHNQVICPHPGSLNPYHVGFMVWQDIDRRYGHGEGRCSKMFEVRESDRDTAFLRRFLTPELMHELDMFSYRSRGDHYVVDAVSEAENADTIRHMLLQQIGCAGMPVIKMLEIDSSGDRTLRLVHLHDGRDLELNQAEKTLQHLKTLWHHDIELETSLRGKRTKMTMNHDGFETKLIN